MQPLCGFDASMLKEWRRLELLEGIGKLEGNGRWKYSVREAVIIAICNSLRLANLPGYVAIKVAKDIQDDVLKTAGFYGSRVQPDFKLLAIWNNEASGQNPQFKGFSQYPPWETYAAVDFEEIYRSITAPAPIVADLHKITKAFPDALKAAMLTAMKELRNE
jgi:hypothetical protein